MKLLLKYLKALAQPAVNRSRSNRTLLWLAGGTTLMAALSSNHTPTVAQTVFPSLPNLQFQTSSPRRCANIGDWYTTDGTTGTTGTTPTNCGSAFGGQNTISTDKIHRFSFNITQAQIDAGGGSITITINDAENASGGSIPDEVLGTGDPTQFSLRDASGNIIGSPITVPSGSANGTNVIFTVNAPGTYQVTSVSGALPISGNNDPDLNNDDNTFKITFSVSGILIGALQGSSQFSVARNTPYSFYFLKPPTASSTTLSLRNFDFDDSPTSIQYISRGGTTTAGTRSSNAVWNGSPANLNTGGNTITATPLTDAGVWEIRISNTSADNQFILEANADTQRLAIYDARPTTAGNFAITANSTLSTTIGTTVCHPFTVKNLFATNDIINLTTANTAAKYTVQLRNAAGTAVLLTDTDGNGQVDTGILTPQQSADFTLCVTPNAGTTTPDTTRINAISFMDNQVDAANNTTLFVDKTTNIPVNVSGTVWQDKNGSANGTFSNIFSTGETGTNAGSLNAILVNSSGKVIASAPVATNGTYTFSNVSGNQTGITIRLSATAGVDGEDAPPVWDPTGTGWTNTSPLTTAAFDLVTSNLANQDFGIERSPDTTTINSPTQSNPGGTTEVRSIAVLAGTDPEDGALGTGKNFKIFGPATNGKIYYNGVEILGSTTIDNYNPTLLTVDPNDGNVNVTFTYAAIDAAGKEDPSPATVTIPFSTSFCTAGGGTNDNAIAPYISNEVRGNIAAARTLVDNLDDTWRTAAGGASTGTVQPWFGTTTAPVGSANSFTYLDPKTASSTSVSVQLVQIPIGTDANCAGTTTTSGGAASLSNSVALQASAPRPASLYDTSNQPLFWNETSAGGTSDVKRNAVLFTFTQPVKSFGAWFGDVETRTINGTPAILRLLDADGNRIGQDITVDPTNMYDGNPPVLQAVNQSLCGGNANTEPGCGNQSTRWIGFVDSSTIARVKQVLVIVGDDDLNDNGDSEHLSFIGVNLIPAANKPNLLLVKRITAINGATSNPNDNTDLSNFDGNDNKTNDDHPNWPTGKNIYLRGAVNGGQVKPGDEVEYTIYFLNTQAAAKNVTICDLVPVNQTFVATAYDANSGIGLLNNTTIPLAPGSLTNAPDEDGGRYYAPGDPSTPALCKKFDSNGNVIASGQAANTDGAIVVEIVKGATQLPASTGIGNPANSYGFVRFRAKVK
jgi:uncharacterized repeat protein (TIGR01451 family)